jgi:hypothetical protein
MKVYLVFLFIFLSSYSRVHAESESLNTEPQTINLRSTLPQSPTIQVEEDG